MWSSLLLQRLISISLLILEEKGVSGRGSFSSGSIAAGPFEPAGKVRIFAMIDSITQGLLQATHDWLMKCL